VNRLPPQLTAIRPESVLTSTGAGGRLRAISVSSRPATSARPASPTSMSTEACEETS
jgi:hypothetical protein